MADLNLAATRQENEALRQECRRLAGIIEGMRAQDRLTALRAQFVAASLESRGADAAIETGFAAADKFVERLNAEAEKARAEFEKSQEENDVGTGVGSGDLRPVLVASQVGNDGS